MKNGSRHLNGRHVILIFLFPLLIPLSWCQTHCFKSYGYWGLRLCLV